MPEALETPTDPTGGAADTGESSSAPGSKQPLASEPKSAGTPAKPSTYDPEMLLEGVPGEKAPIKAKDLYNRLRAGVTKTEQQFKKEREAFEAERQKYQAETRAERQRLEQIAATLMSQQQGREAPDEFLAELSGKQYLDGMTGAKLVQYLRKQTATERAQLVEHINKQNQVIVAIVGKLKELGGHVTEFHSTAEQTRQQKQIDAALKAAGLDDDARDLASELLAAYEGDDLEVEFPNLLKGRWNQIEAAIRNRDKAKVARLKQPSAFAARGGDGAAARGAKFTGKESAREMADKLWSEMEGTEADS